MLARSRVFRFFKWSALALALGVAGVIQGVIASGSVNTLNNVNAGTEAWSQSAADAHSSAV